MRSYSQTKQIFSRMTKPLLAAGIMAGLIGCSAFEPEYGKCPPISAAKGAEESYIIGSKLGQLVKLRFNGIAGQCVARDGYTDTRIFMRLLLRRDMTTGSNIERTEFYVTAAIIDENDSVVSRATFAEEGNFKDGMDISQPDIKYRVDVPDGHRVVLAIGRAAE
ncbi:MAG: hypothetical protein P8N97_03540 [Alphaproteobacteria bacterium]|nr:hypothetical protein [Alphaproteobacteria bacterium]